jgi:hypothetical protein
MSLTHAMPRAFDGTSALQSGIVSVVTLLFAVATGWAGVKLRPRSWALVVAATGMLLTALAMVTVTLASTGEGGTPPDGALAIPYLAPVALFGLGLGVSGRARILFRSRSLLRKVIGVPVSIGAATLLFLAYEASFLAAH